MIVRYDGGAEYFSLRPGKTYICVGGMGGQVTRVINDIGAVLTALTQYFTIVEHISVPLKVGDRVVFHTRSKLGGGYCVPGTKGTVLDVRRTRGTVSIDGIRHPFNQQQFYLDEVDKLVIVIEGDDDEDTI